MFDISDIRNVQKVRPDLSDEQAGDVIGFLTDVYAEKSYKVNDTQKLFKQTADYIYPLLLISA